MSLGEAMDEVEVEDACKALALDDDDIAYVLATHRLSDKDLMRTCFSHGCDWQGYVRCRLAIRDGMFRK